MAYSSLVNVVDFRGTNSNGIDRENCEQSQEISENLSKMLTLEQWEIRNFARARFAIDSIVEAKPDLVILDLSTHREEGLAFMSSLR